MHFENGDQTFHNNINVMITLLMAMFLCADRSFRFHLMWEVFGLLSQLLIGVITQHWWNFDDRINPHEIPVFIPLPNQRFTHSAQVDLRGPMPNDIIVNIPKAGMGTFVGFSLRVNYDFTWSEWPPQPGRLVNTFLGIPYAAPPVKNQRFRKPIPAYLDTRYPWYATSYRSACMQASSVFHNFIRNFSDFSEDCLYLNIFYPNRTWEDPLVRYPVVVHIHGGSFVYGSSHLYPAQVLASLGVVVVTFNYRLGPFGFLSTGDSASMGNYGLWDQLLALRWVKENIEWFRGDPKQITLMGESAGAASVGLHAVSPASRDQDLYHRLIMMSGSELCPWAVSDPNRIRSRYYAIELGRKLGCSAVQGTSVRKSQEAMFVEPWIEGNRSAGANSSSSSSFGRSTVRERLSVPSYARIDATALVRCLRYEKTAEEILSAAKSIKNLRGATPFLWTPVVDGTAGFLPRLPIEERKLGHFAKVPLLAGVVHDEGSRPLMQRIFHWEGQYIYPENFTDAVARRTIGNFLNWENVLRFEATAEELYTWYTWWPNMANNTARWERIVALISDYEINSPLVTTVNYHSSVSDQVYFYEFAHAGLRKSGLSWAGIYHGSELPFLLGAPFVNLTFWQTMFGPKSIPNLASIQFHYPHDTNVSEFMMELWTNFIKFGNPTPEEVKNISWSPYKSPHEAYLFVYLNSTIKYKFRQLHMAFWRERFTKLAEPVAPSPPLIYYPWFISQWLTIILSSLVGLMLIIFITLVVLLSKRPTPDEFRHNIRLATPGAAPGSAFQAAFRDAFANRSQMPRQSIPRAQTVYQPGEEMRLLSPTVYSEATVGPERSHPAPPPVPSASRYQTYASRRRMYR